MSILRRVAALCVLFLPMQSVAQPISVRVDPNVELISTLFRNAGRAEYATGKLTRWNAAVDSLFAVHSGGDAVAITRRLAGPYRVGFLAPVSLAVHLDSATQLRFSTGSVAPRSLHSSWLTFPDSTRLFVDAFAHFRREVQFDQLLQQQRPLVTAAQQRLRTLVNRHVKPGWFRQFWGDSTLKQVTIVPALTFSGANYGLDVIKEDQHREAFAVIGVRRADAGGLPVFDTSDVSIVVHELNHPYVTQLLRGSVAPLRQLADSLYRSAAADMRRAGYGSADAMLNELLVRAAVVRYLAENTSEAAAANEILLQEKEGFTFIRGVVNAFAEYQAQRSRYRSMNEFLPTMMQRLSSGPTR